MATQKTEKPETATPTAAGKQRKQRVPKTLTPLEAQVLASLNEQKVTARALCGVAKAVSQLGTAQAKHILTTALESLENMPPVADNDGSAS
jgi:hypothetical protein